MEAPCLNTEFYVGWTMYTYMYNNLDKLRISSLNLFFVLYSYDSSFYLLYQVSYSI